MHLVLIKKERHTKSKKEFALYAKNIMKLKKWKVITLLLGMRVGLQFLKIAKCFAKKIIGENLGNKNRLRASLRFGEEGAKMDR